MNIFNKGVSIMKENKVKAVHDDDLVQLLQFVLLVIKMNVIRN